MTSDTRRVIDTMSPWAVPERSPAVLEASYAIDGGVFCLSDQALAFKGARLTVSYTSEKAVFFCDELLGSTDELLRFYRNLSDVSNINNNRFFIGMTGKDGNRVWLRFAGALLVRTGTCGRLSDKDMLIIKVQIDCRACQVIADRTDKPRDNPDSLFTFNSVDQIPFAYLEFNPGSLVGCMGTVSLVAQDITVARKGDVARVTLGKVTAKENDWLAFKHYYADCAPMKLHDLKSNAPLLQEAGMRLAPGPHEAKTMEGGDRNMVVARHIVLSNYWAKFITPAGKTTLTPKDKELLFGQHYGRLEHAPLAKLKPGLVYSVVEPHVEADRVVLKVEYPAKFIGRHYTLEDVSMNVKYAPMSADTVAVTLDNVVIDVAYCNKLLAQNVVIDRSNDICTVTIGRLTGRYSAWKKFLADHSVPAELIINDIHDVPYKLGNLRINNTDNNGYVLLTTDDEVLVENVILTNKPSLSVEELAERLKEEALAAKDRRMEEALAECLKEEAKTYMPVSHGL